MTAAARRNEFARAFTLIELVLVLAVAALVMGGAAGFMVYSSDERALRAASGEIEALAKRARTKAVLEQAPQALLFREGSVRLMTLGAAMTEIEQHFSRKRNRRAAAVDGGASGGGYTVANGMSLAVRRWNSQRWLPAEKNAIHLWRFDPDGLCEPLSIRLELDQSWAEDIYHPLTASIRESRLEAR